MAKGTAAAKAREDISEAAPYLVHLPSGRA